MLKRFPFKINGGENGEIKFINNVEISTSPVECTTKYLSYIKEQAQTLTGKDVNKCVLTLPRFIEESGKEEIKESFLKADLEIIEIIDESKAVIKAYELNEKENVKNVIVFNFGGTNLSITYLNREGEGKELIKNEFDLKKDFFDFELGGNDIDKMIINLCLEEFKRVNKMDISQELYALQRIAEAAEKAKIELSLSQQVEISLPFLAADHTGPKHLNLKFSRSKFENLSDPISMKLQKICRDFIKDSELKKEEIDEIVLLGGVCRIPKIQEIIKSEFGKEANKNVNPEEAAAIGGAIMVRKNIKI